MAAQCNPTIPSDQCTLQTCCLQQGTVNYLPTVAGNLVFAIIFAFFLAIQLAQGIYYKTWGFLVGITCGCILEVLGYGGRVWMHYQIFQMNPFLLYLICLTIAPAFLTASIYLTLGRLITAYGTRFSRFRPATYTIVFVTCDIISLVLQAAGGAVTSIADTGSALQDQGVDVMITGLAFQVASLFLFILLCLDFAWSVYRSTERREPAFDVLRSSLKFKLFQGALAVAVLTIFIRCCYRVAELQAGFGGALANNEVVFMILEAPMIIIALGALTLFHPGFVYGDFWHVANFSFRKRKTVQGEGSNVDGVMSDAGSGYDLKDRV